MSEFDLIRRYFTRATPGALLGVGDDAALLQASDGNVLAVSCDMLVSGTHFFADADPYLLGHKTLAVNLSDMAAMGAAPRWATLAIALPGADEAWLEKFSAGFFALAQQHGVELIGGDTTRGPLNLCVTIIGEVPAAQALRRSGAQIGDEIWVSGSLGDAALALAHLHGLTVLSVAEFDACAAALHQPQPRVALGKALRGIASSAIDISDGLLADLGHILDASQAGARLDFAALPVSPVMRGQVTGARASCPQISGQDARAPANNLLGKQCVLSGGDDYELCFTAPAMRHAEILKIGAGLELPLTPIGEIVAGRGCIVHDASGNPVKPESSGYDHFP
ncbi:MAG: thiamine-phosphate kinase [Gallionellales bacterium RIFCSPLOWO2_02_FULL_57_47]|nr:MAG: thiamine-phosphate kinase [Gallionellales bacterium RIFCSPLOWO2_02_FULL_57_47]OGT07939.1 MAG: thiamine-phosphate kinase [Gallionellales bacterium RIFCSPHIGHO2_02_FULL_57_16]